MKYIVYWVLVEVISIPCNFTRVPDQFGRVDYSFTPALNCVKEQRTKHSKEFFSRDEYKKFWRDAVKENERLSPFKPIDSLRVDSISLKIQN